MELAKRAVSLTDFSCRYGAEGPLRLCKVSFEVGVGEFVAIIGPSGGGKSSLVFSINGLIPHEIVGSETAGEVWVLDLNVREHAPHELMRAVGTVLQDSEWQLVTFTVADEIAFGLENLGVSAREIQQRIDELAHLLDLEAFLDHTPDELSGGQKQRLAIASCLALKPPILLLDEPMAELDPVGKRAVMEAVSLLNREFGVTILLIEHNLDLVAPYADKIVIVADGSIVAQGGPREVLKDVGMLQSTRLRPPQPMEIASLLPAPIRPPCPPLTVSELVQWLCPLDEPKVGSEMEPPHLTGWPSQREPIVQTKDVSYSYFDGTQAVQGVDLSIFPGDYIGLIGQNGAGKSTFAKLLVDLLHPQKGEVTFKGQPISDLSRKEIGTCIGYVFQNPDVQFFSRTCFDEVAFGLRLRGESKHEIEKRVKAVLEQLEVDAYLNEHPHFLSRGQRRRIAIATVLVLEPEILILDEPTTGLDTGNATRMLEMVHQLHQRGHTIILLTHEMSTVLQYCTRLVLMHDGQVILDDDPRRAFQKREVLESYHIHLPPVAECMLGFSWRSSFLLPRTSQEAASLILRALEY